MRLKLDFHTQNMPCMCEITLPLVFHCHFLIHWEIFSFEQGSLDELQIFWKFSLQYLYLNVSLHLLLYLNLHHTHFIHTKVPHQLILFDTFPQHLQIFYPLHMCLFPCVFLILILCHSCTHLPTDFFCHLFFYCHLLKP